MQEMNIVLDKGALFEWMPCQLNGWALFNGWAHGWAGG